MVVVTLAIASSAEAQYFGRNKVQYRDFAFEVLATEHFDIYFYPEERDAADDVARLAERWHARLSTLLRHPIWAPPWISARRARGCPTSTRM